MIYICKVSSLRGRKGQLVSVRDEETARQLKTQGVIGDYKPTKKKGGRKAKKVYGAETK